MLCVLTDGFSSVISLLVITHQNHQAAALRLFCSLWARLPSERPAIDTQPGREFLFLTKKDTAFCLSAD